MFGYIKLNYVIYVFIFSNNRDYFSPTESKIGTPLTSTSFVGITVPALGILFAEFDREPLPFRMYAFIVFTMKKRKGEPNNWYEEIK